jgi:predicted nucleic acid-binding protein
VTDAPWRVTVMAPARRRFEKLPVAVAAAVLETLDAIAENPQCLGKPDAIAGMGISVAPLTATVAERAAELQARHQRLRLPDAIVLACARDLGGELLSYDERLTRIAQEP